MDLWWHGNRSLPTEANPSNIPPNKNQEKTNSECGWRRDLEKREHNPGGTERPRCSCQRCDHEPNYSPLTTLCDAPYEVRPPLVEDVQAPGHECRDQHGHDAAKERCKNSENVCRGHSHGSSAA